MEKPLMIKQETSGFDVVMSRRFECFAVWRILIVAGFSCLVNLKDSDSLFDLRKSKQTHVLSMWLWKVD